MGHLLLVGLILLGGCASNPESSSSKNGSSESGIALEAEERVTVEGIEPTVVSYENYKDPLIGFNRAIFSFNDASYRYLLIPAAHGYIKVVPEGVRQCVSNFFYNIKSPLYFVNNLLQWKPKNAGVNAARFGINSTLGLLGLFDPAERWFEIEKKETDFEETLIQYGVGYGVYLVLPFIGSSDLRNGTSSIAGALLHPISYITEGGERVVIESFDYFQEFAPLADSYPDLVDQSDDPYLFMRNFYLQQIQRDAAYQERAAETDGD